jgi:Domain of unknown function (DUF6471)
LASIKFADTLYFIAVTQTKWAFGMSVKEVEREWAEKTQRLVKAELKRASVTYEELANRLRAMGLQETKVSIASKLSRAGFSASFFLATMKAIGRQTVNLEEV